VFALTWKLTCVESINNTGFLLRKVKSKDQVRTGWITIQNNTEQQWNIPMIGDCDIVVLLSVMQHITPRENFQMNLTIWLEQKYREIRQVSAPFSKSRT
jgi:hypothetical protein